MRRAESDQYGLSATLHRDHVLYAAPDGHEDDLHSRWKRVLHASIKCRVGAMGGLRRRPRVAHPDLLYARIGDLCGRAMPGLAGYPALRRLHARDLHAAALGAGQLFARQHADPEFQLHPGNGNVQPGTMPVAAEHAALPDLHRGDLYARIVAAVAVFTGIDADPSDQLHARDRDLQPGTVPNKSAEHEDVSNSRLCDAGRLRFRERHLLAGHAKRRYHLGRGARLQQRHLVVHAVEFCLFDAKLLGDSIVFDEHEYVEHLSGARPSHHYNLLAWDLQGERQLSRISRFFHSDESRELHR